jgi:molecular chaperone DnaK (HSP70)
MCPGLVITVPAHFSSEQVEATRRAAARANFAQVEIIYEPEAAAYYYEAFLGNKMKRLPNDSSVLVVDFGGGTFDLSILKVVYPLQTIKQTYKFSSIQTKKLLSSSPRAAVTTC